MRNRLISVGVSPRHERERDFLHEAATCFASAVVGSPRIWEDLRDADERCGRPG